MIAVPTTLRLLHSSSSCLDLDECAPHASLVDTSGFDSSRELIKLLFQYHYLSY